MRQNPKPFTDSVLDLEPRDYLYALEWHFDLDAQLIAIRGLLSRNRNADENLTTEINQIEEHTRRLHGIAAEHAVDDWVDRIQHSAYQGAAHSMAAVGMLAPLVETTFHQFFLGIQRRFHSKCNPAERHGRFKAENDIQWDCHWVLRGNRWKKDLVGGIIQLSESLDLISRLPSDLKAVLSALFAYRNKMFHLGLEWPQSEREQFAKRIKADGWSSEWFPIATSGELPWIFYLSDDFITHCLNTFDQVLNGLGTFVAERVQEEPTP